MALASGSAFNGVSLEYFPASGASAESALMNGSHALARFNPDFQTVTFGAGGSDAGGSLDWANRLQGLTGIPTACHLAMSRFDRAGLIGFSERLKEIGIQRIVLIRGDATENGDDGLAGFASVADATRTLKKRFGFDISVAAYPEVHPKAFSAESDIDVLLAKQDAGADRAITQYFFDNEHFLRFRDRAAKAGLRIPLVAGIMPIANFEKIVGFSEKCGTSVPQWLTKKFSDTGDDKSLRTEIARTIVQDQVRALAQNGIQQIHIYTLNRTDLAAAAIRSFIEHRHQCQETPHQRAVA